MDFKVKSRINREFVIQAAIPKIQESNMKYLFQFCEPMKEKMRYSAGVQNDRGLALQPKRV